MMAPPDPAIPLSTVLQFIVLPLLYVVWQSLTARMREQAAETAAALAREREARERAEHDAAQRLRALEIRLPETYATKSELADLAEQIRASIAELAASQGEVSRELREVAGAMRAASRPRRRRSER